MDTIAVASLMPNPFAGHGVGVFAKLAAEADQFNYYPEPVDGQGGGRDDRWNTLKHGAVVTQHSGMGEAGTRF